MHRWLHFRRVQRDVQAMFAVSVELYYELWGPFFHLAIFDDPSLDLAAAFEATHRRYLAAIRGDVARRILDSRNRRTLRPLPKQDRGRRTRRSHIRRLDPEVLAYSLMGIGDFIGMRWVLWEKKAMRPAVIETMMDFMLRGVDAGRPA
jgi:hypothetical protein